MNELVKRLREVADEVDNDYDADPYNAEQRCLTILQAADAIEELSRRETPMLVRITASTKRCPSCNKQLSGRGNIHCNYRFCRWCGQALDWTEPPKEE